VAEVEGSRELPTFVPDSRRRKDALSMPAARAGEMPVFNLAVPPKNA
jgi:hypothetical protein